MSVIMCGYHVQLSTTMQHNQYLFLCLLTSTWPHLRCDVGLEEVEY